MIGLEAQSSFFPNETELICEATELDTETLATSEDIINLENTIYASNRLLGCGLLDSYFQNIEFEGRVEVRTVFVMGCVPNQAEIELMREQQEE